MEIKKNMFRYYRGTRSCVKCSQNTRLFMKSEYKIFNSFRCSDQNCVRGVLRKECSEFEISNEINFMRKLFERKSENSQDMKNDKISETTMSSILDNTRNIEVEFQN